MTQLAMVGAEMGIPVHLIFNEKSPFIIEGNHLLVKYFGANVHYNHGNNKLSNTERKKELASDLLSGGDKPFVIDYPISNYTAYFGYMRCLLELIKQMEDGCFDDAKNLHVFICSGWHSYLGMRMAADILKTDIRITAYRPTYWLGGGLDNFYPNFEIFIKDKVSEFSDYIDYEIPTYKFDLREEFIGHTKEIVNKLKLQ
mgnify:FL=1